MNLPKYSNSGGDEPKENAMKSFLLLAIVSSCLPIARGQSTIAYFPGPSFQVPAAHGYSKGVDFDADGTPEFVFWSYGPICTDDIPTSFCSWSFYVGATGTNALLVSDYALVQSAGAQIGSNAPAGSTWSTAQPYGATLTASWWSLHGRIVDGQTVYNGWDGTLGALTNGYLGVRFKAQDGFHYGWIRVRLPSTESGAEGFLIEIAPVVVEWAYETRPNTAILAGAKPVVVPLASPEIARPGYLRLRWPSEIGKAYQVQWKANLAAPLWMNLDFVAIGATTNSAVDIPTVGTTKFFRVVEAD